MEASEKDGKTEAETRGYMGLLMIDRKGRDGWVHGESRSSFDTRE
jgi:hypothetical protein